MRVYRYALSSLIFVNILSIFGYATFSRNSQLLNTYPWAQPIFENAYWFFARLQILLSLVAFIGLLQSKVRIRWFLAFVVAVLVSSVSELAGTSYGLPFGSYEYTDLLGPKLFQKVPYLIPLSWFFMGLASYGISRAMIEEARFSIYRIFWASWLLVSWDLTLDPAMSHLAPFWTWNESGPYFGTPLLNLFGWYVTGVIIMLGFELLNVRTWLKQIPTKYFIHFYLANLILPLGIVVAAGLWEAVVISFVCYATVALIFFIRRTFWKPVWASHVSL